MNTTPLITVVIPTIGRDSLQHAVASVLAQSYPNVHVIVVADTEKAVELPDSVSLIRVGPRAGGNVARMTGVRAAAPGWVAFLDDDDTWLPTKLEHQWRLIREATIEADDSWISATAVSRSSYGVWPTRQIQDNEPISSYLFRKTRFRAGTGALPTSTLLFPKSLALRIPLDESLKFHQDTDWMLRLDQENVRVLQLQTPEVSVYDDDEGFSVSKSITADGSLAWARTAMNHTDRRTRGDFIASVPLYYAWRARDYRAVVKCMAAALRLGPPTVYGVFGFVALPAKELAKRARAARRRGKQS